MPSIIKFRPSVLTGAVGIMLMTQASASANPFGALDDILNTIDRATGTLDRTTNTVNRTTSSANRLFDTLGLSPEAVGSSIDSADSTEQVLKIYEAWYGTLSGDDKETVSWLVMQHARNQNVTFETISGSEWFMEKPITEQSHVSGIFFKLQQVIDSTADDKDRFLAFAFCVNSGAEGCTP